jgi:hypothetical protein
MNTPSDEARRIVDALGEQAGIVDEKLHSFPKHLFRVFCAVDGLAVTAAATELIIKREPAYAALQGYWLAVLHACANAAASTRLSGDAAWRAVVDAQKHAGVALALFVSSANARDAKKALARHAKEVQTKINDRLRLHVLKAAADSTLKTPTSAAASIVRKLEGRDGDLSEAMQEFGVSLKPEREPLARVFGEYIKKDMERLGLRSPDKKVPQSLNRELFSRWKKLYVSPANG